MRMDAEWLESDGLGGYASGTVSGVRSRRYHALLLAAQNPPTERLVLVNGFEAWVETPAGRTPLSSHRYAPDVTYPDGHRHVVEFEPVPWPRWRFRFEDGTEILQEIFLTRGARVAYVSWTLLTGSVARLDVRPLLSGRDIHATHHENGAFDFTPEPRPDGVSWQPYPGLPRIHSLSNGAYAHLPDWYRSFQYDEERARGLDFLEDLASPGVLTWDLTRGRAVWLLIAEVPGSESTLTSGEAVSALAGKLRTVERLRRGRFPTPLHQAADAYVVRRGSGRTIIAGFPWFADWGRDTFIALRGIALAGGRLGDAGAILLAWADLVSEGMLPNFFPEGGRAPEYNSVDASLWYIVAVHEYLGALEARGSRIRSRDRRGLEAAVEAILSGYARGTRFGIRADADGLLAAGEPGVQLTWMDAKVGDWVVTPRIGKPVEVQALWLNALRIGAALDPSWGDLLARAGDSFPARFWNAEGEYLYDVVDVDHRGGALDPSFRPNQVFAVGGLPWPVLSGETAWMAERVVEAVDGRLFTPMGLRSLAPEDPGYRGRCVGGVLERDGAYHQGTVWPWLAGPFVEAWLRVRGSTRTARSEARTRFLEPLLRHLEDAGLGHVSEIADGDPPHTPRGCPFQAWSVGELLRMVELLGEADRKAAPQRVAPTT